jgi:hypothetical protein
LPGEFEFCDKHDASGWTCRYECKIKALQVAPPTARNSTQFVDEDRTKIKGSYGNNSWEAGEYILDRPGGFKTRILSGDDFHVTRMKEGTQNRRSINKKIEALNAGKSLKEVQSIH